MGGVWVDPLPTTLSNGTIRRNVLAAFLAKMGKALLRLLGLLLLTLGITVSSCQALFPLESRAGGQYEVTSGFGSADAR
jgi:hypothetical protein